MEDRSGVNKNRTAGREACRTEPRGRPGDLLRASGCRISGLAHIVVIHEAVFTA